MDPTQANERGATAHDPDDRRLRDPPLMDDEPTQFRWWHGLLLVLAAGAILTACLVYRIYREFRLRLGRRHPIL